MRILGLPVQPDTYIEVDIDTEWTIPQSTVYSKAKWTPFAGKQVKGLIHRVVLRGQVVCIEGKVLAEPGFGRDLRDLSLGGKKHAHVGSQASLNISAPIAIETDVHGNIKNNISLYKHIYYIYI